ncbi:hypothetical protein ACF08N_21400 [Streptomyces sp. NPDC015127]|uniref:hypothetical protein n=1 Tax=Streptomyces sp. NPDC015127 TaxID=3364939 RepID=UPI0036F72903
MLRLLAGIDAPAEGRITGRPRTAYVPVPFPAALPFSAHGYLVHLARIHGLGRRVAAAAVVEWLERFGAAGHARTPLGAVATGIVVLISDARNADHRVVIPLLPAVAAGLLACAVSVLVLAPRWERCAPGPCCTRAAGRSWPPRRRSCRPW